MGSQAAAFAFATPVGAPSRGATGSRRIARGGALGDGERRVSCAAASGSRADFSASHCGPSQKDTSTAWARRHDARVAGARGERLRLRRAPSAVSHREGSLDASCDEGDVGNDETGAARASGASPLGTATAAQTNPSASSSSSRVVEFVAAWDALSPRLAAAASSGAAFVPPGAAADALAPDARGNREMLLGALKLAIPRLQAIPEDRRRPGGSPRSGAPERALSDGNDETSVKRHRPAHERAVAEALRGERRPVSSSLRDQQSGPCSDWGVCRNPSPCASRPSCNGVNLCLAGVAVCVLRFARRPVDSDGLSGGVTHESLRSVTVLRGPTGLVGRAASRSRAGDPVP